MELYGLLNEKEKLTASLSAGVDYYKGDKGEDGGTVWFIEQRLIADNRCKLSLLQGKEGLTPAVNDLVFTEAFNFYRIDRILVKTWGYLDLIGNFQGEKGDQGIPGEKGEQGERGLQGCIFTPSVSSTGIISWSNNGELPNPSSVDLVAAVISALPSAVGVNF